ncbi:hypothetical protein [Spiroplasma sp. ald]|uniref:hypothetical protein n=1 Tax=Spiroplasma sp. ald TaxID=2490849 RepID=UPI0037DD92ED
MGKNLFEQTLNVDRTEINFNKVKENKINQSSISNNPFINQPISPNDNLEKQKVKNVNITLYENDILKMKIITQITGAKLSSFVRKCINEEYQKVINNK